MGCPGPSGFVEMDPQGRRLMSHLYEKHIVMHLLFLWRASHYKRTPDFPGVEKLYFRSLRLGGGILFTWDPLPSWSDVTLITIPLFPGKYVPARPIFFWFSLTSLYWLKNGLLGTSLVVQWPRIYAPNAKSLGLIPGQGSRSHMPQLRPSTAKYIKINLK